MWKSNALASTWQHAMLSLVQMWNFYGKSSLPQAPGAFLVICIGIDMKEKSCLMRRQVDQSELVFHFVSMSCIFLMANGGDSCCFLAFPEDQPSSPLELHPCGWAAVEVVHRQEGLGRERRRFVTWRS